MFHIQFNRSVTSRGSRGSDEPSILNSFYLNQLSIPRFITTSYIMNSCPYVLIYSSKSKFIPENIRNTLMEDSTVATQVTVSFLLGEFI